MMNRPPILAILTAAVALASTSCIVDKPVGSDRGEKDAVLSFNPQAGDHGKTRGATYDETWTEFAAFFGGSAAQEEDIFNAPDPNPDERPDGWGRAADRRIATFRVLVYHATSDATLGFAAGDLVKNRGQYMNRLFEWTDDELDTARKPPFELSVPRGTYDFVFVANENRLGDVFAVDPDTGEVDPRIATLAEFKKLTFAHDTEIATDSGAIPMTGWYPGVVVSPDEIAYTEEGTPKTAATGNEGTWEVRLTRAAIRLSFGIHLGAAEYAAWMAYHAGADPLLYIAGLRSAGYVYPHPAADRDNGGVAFDMAAPEAIAASTVQSGVGIRPGKVWMRGDGSADLFFDRLIFPEHQPAPALKNSATVGVRAYMRFDYGSRVVQKEIPVHAVDGDGALTAMGYSLPRGTWVWARATMMTDVEHTVRVVPWGGGALRTPIDQWNLTADRSEFLFRGHASSSRMTLTTDHPGGWDATVQSDGAGWLTLGAGTTQHGETGVATRVTVNASANGNGDNRTGTIVVTAGKLVRTITVVQLPGSGAIVDTPDPPRPMFVGAFWRADQFGERLIRLGRPGSGSMDGPWTAHVADGADWIVLDTATSPDPGVWTISTRDALTYTDFDRIHRVSGFATSVSGTVDGGASITTPRHLREVYFRVGLRGPYTPTAEQPARYGMILLMYKKNGQTAYQRIWVRQGEGADYLVPRSDGRPKSVKFSPFNLTVPTDRPYGSGGWAQLDPIEKAGRTGGGAFTDYPSRAGAFFQFAPALYPRHAFRPSGDIDYDAGRVAQTNSGTWNPATMETCPPGWRRPDAATDFDETVQSLSLAGTPDVVGNTTWGYYADGMFDRGAMHSGSTVSSGETIAYIGGLIYNDDVESSHYGASVFFPNSGFHSTSGNGSFPASETGHVGNYWTTTAEGMSGTYSMMFEYHFDQPSTSASVRRVGIPRLAGAYVRCVVDETPAVLSVSPATLAFTYGGGTRNVEVASSSDDGFAARWVVTGFSTDGGATFLGPDQRPSWLTMPATGVGALPGETQTVTIAVADNPGLSPRSVVVRLAQIDRPDLQATITIAQEF